MAESKGGIGTPADIGIGEYASEPLGQRGCRRAHPGKKEVHNNIHALKTDRDHQTVANGAHRPQPDNQPNQREDYKNHEQCAQVDDRLEQSLNGVKKSVHLPKFLPCKK